MKTHFQGEKKKKKSFSPLSMFSVILHHLSHLSFSSGVLPLPHSPPHMTNWWKLSQVFSRKLSPCLPQSSSCLQLLDHLVRAALEHKRLGKHQWLQCPKALSLDSQKSKQRSDRSTGIKSTKTLETLNVLS